nr:amidohydrolase family protein [Robbsia andropogonis]
MPIVLHCGSSDAEKCIKSGEPGQGEHWDGIDATVARHPNTTFVHAHFGGLGKYVSPEPNHAKKLRQMLEKHPNYKLDISWDVVAEAYSSNSKYDVGDPRRQNDGAERKARIEEMAMLVRDHPDRFIYGSDALVSRNPKSISATYDL